jgi:FAD/FMN-containing dehydrogenase
MKKGSSQSLTVRHADTKKRKTTTKEVVVKKTVSKTKSVKKVKATPKKAVKKVTKKKVVTKKITVKKAPATKKKSVAKKSPAPIAITPIKREPLGHLLIEKLLREAGFRGGVSTNKDILTRYSTDESIFSIRPQIALQPKDQRDIEIAVQTLQKETLRFPSVSLTPRAAGTGLSGGSLTDSIVLDVTTHMNHIGEVVTKKGMTTITCQPGVMWRDAEKLLKKHGVYLPSYPASKDICSIGGAVGNNAAGPDSLRYGHTADWVDSLDVTLHDGNTYTFRALTYKEYKTLIKKSNAHAEIARSIFELIEQNEKTIQHAKPKTKKNSAGYPLWGVLSTTVANFKKGNGTFDLTRIISGSQGTIGVITSVTMRTEPIQNNTQLIVVPVFDLLDAGAVITKALEFNPNNIELFDGFTFDLALKNPEFFKDRLGKIDYYKVLLSMYTTYHVRYGRKTPDFTLLITLDTEKLGKRSADGIVKTLRANRGKRARLVQNAIEKEMFWQIRRASYSLSKFQDPNKRPAAFLEDMTVPPQNLSRFFVDIKKLLKKFNVAAAVHGHGGNGHLHFYPLLDFTSKATPSLVEKMAEEFFATAVKYDGNICGEHNDGIIRTPHLNKMFNKKTLELFRTVEHTFDPTDIFNPGKKVNPRFDVKESLRKTN